MVELSVVICTFNPRREYLSRVCAALRAQTLPLDRWELLIVDSGSGTHVSSHEDLGWHPRAQHVREETAGLTRARFRGLEDSSGEVVVFVDDDNLLAPDFLEKARAIRTRFPDVGVFGAGTIAPEFESQPPREMRRHLSRLALRTLPQRRMSRDTSDSDSIPWGAGLCVARVVGARYRSFVERLNMGNVLGRTGDRLFDGEDDLFSWLAASMGLQFGVFPELQLTHLIPSGRLTRSYMVRLIEDHAFSSGIRHHVMSGVPLNTLTMRACAAVVADGLRRGSFSMRCRWAQVIGEHRAAKYVASRGIRPIPESRRLELAELPMSDA